MPLVKAVDPRVTFAELAAWPDDGRRYELYDGEVIVVPAPFSRHQRVVANVEDLLRAYEHTSGGMALQSPFDIVFSEHNVLQPDVVFFRTERRHLVPVDEATRAAPDLVVEVVSRSTEVRDRGRKMQTFARFGVPEYWIVDPIKNTLEIYELSGAEYRLAGSYDDQQSVASPTLTSLSFKVRRLFDE